MLDIKFDRVSKKYRIRSASGRGADRPSLLTRRLRGRRGDFWALKDVSFSVRRGDTLGIIGPNGAGKSTILKLLSKITAPTAGEITISGRLSALIEVGSGFHPELTGRENVFLSGSILGMRRREIAQKLESIVEFAGVRQFFDTPIKHYSSGMCVRLGFSIAAHLDPDILLLDEVLAVGDAAFQSKCFSRINQLKESGTTIVFISHDLNAIDYLCHRAVLLVDGEIAADGAPRNVIARYQASPNAAAPTDFVSPAAGNTRNVVRITGLSFLDLDGTPLVSTFTGSPLVARLEFEAREAIDDLAFEIFFYSQDGKLQCQYSTDLGGDRIDLAAGAGAVEFSCAELGLQPDSYHVDVVIKRRGGEEIDWQYRYAALRVERGKTVGGRFYAPHTWRLVREDSIVARIQDQQSCVEIASGD
jgi:ABC-type polysaccharide/polyol phosphate transport system ATPase subunit